MSTTVLTTIPSAASNGVPPAIVNDAPAETEGAEATTEATNPETVETSTPEVPATDPDLEHSRTLERIARKEAKARQAEIQLQSKIAAIEAREKELAAKQAELEEALKDPLAYATKRGEDPMDIALRLAKPKSEIETKIEALERRLQEKEKAETESRTKQEQAEAARREQAFWSDFVQGITPDAAPHLTALHPPGDIPKLVKGMLNRPADPSDKDSPTVLQVFRQKYRRDPTHDEIVEGLEQAAASRATDLLSRLPKPKTLDTTTSQTANGTSLSNQHGSASSVTPSETKTREQIIKELQAEMEAEVAASE